MLCVRNGSPPLELFTMEATWILTHEKRSSEFSVTFQNMTVRLLLMTPHTWVMNLEKWSLCWPGIFILPLSSFPNAGRCYAQYWRRNCQSWSQLWAQWATSATYLFFYLGFSFSLPPPSILCIGLLEISLTELWSRQGVCSPVCCNLCSFIFSSRALWNIHPLHSQKQSLSSSHLA